MFGHQTTRQLKAWGFFAYVGLSIIFYWTCITPWLIPLLLLRNVPTWLRITVNRALGFVVGMWLKSVIGYIELVMGTSIVLYAAEPHNVEGQSSTLVDPRTHSSHSSPTPATPSLPSPMSASNPAATLPATGNHSMYGTGAVSLASLLPRPNERALIISNHPTRLDWLYLSAILASPAFKIVLKKPLAYVPWAGWTIQAANYLFLEREWARDASHIQGLCNYWDKYVQKPHVLIFPEGTNLSQETLEISHRFSTKSGLPVWSQVLVPRITGFAALAKALGRACSMYGDSQEDDDSVPAVPTTANEVVARTALLREDNDINNAEERKVAMPENDVTTVAKAALRAHQQMAGLDVVCDFTIAYSPCVVEGESEMLRGEFPTHVHILCDRYAPSEVPFDDEAALKDWLYERFAAKEQLLSLFYASHSASTPKEGHPSPSLRGAPLDHPASADSSQSNECSAGTSLGDMVSCPEPTSHRSIELVSTPPLVTPFTPGLKGHVVRREPKDVAECAIALAVILFGIFCSSSYLFASSGSRTLRLLVFLLYHALSIYYLTQNRVRLDVWLLEATKV